jgi:DNA-binding response OmpR family regulator
MTYTPNVLLLDQDPLLRKATALLLSNRGAVVSATGTLEEAISLSREHLHDVAVIDLTLSMPAAGELLRRLRREGMVPRRIVLCSSEPILSEEAGDFCEVLIKPYAFDRLLRAIFGELHARRPCQSGVFPRLRVVEGGARPAELCDEPSGRAGRRGRGASAGRALRAMRRAPRGCRHPG